MAAGEPSSRTALIGEDWRHYMQLSSEYLLAPTLGYRLPALAREGKKEVDFGDVSAAEILDFYRAATTLNKKRNLQILGTARDAIGVLNDANITPTLIKGLALLHAEDEHALATRMLSDFDVLVDKPDFRTAITVLQANGFNCEDESERVYFEDLGFSTRREYPPMQSDAPIFIDLHRDLFLPFRFSARSTEDIIGDAIEHTGDLGRYKIPLARDRLLHSVFHCAVQNSGHRTGELDIRQFVDTRRLLDVCNEDNFDSVSDLFRASGLQTKWRQWKRSYDVMTSHESSLSDLPLNVQLRLKHPRLGPIIDSIQTPIRKLTRHPVTFLLPVTWRRFIDRRLGRHQ